MIHILDFNAVSGYNNIFAIEGAPSFNIPLFAGSAGGFLVLGIALAIIAAVTNHKAAKEREKARAAKLAAAQAAKGGK